MRKITLIIILISVCFGYAQNAPIDFESGGHGALWTWTVFENDANPAVEIIANPVSGGINTSATVMKFTALDAGMNWAGCESQHGSDIGEWTVTSSNAYVTMKVYQVGFATQVALKFATNSGAAIGEQFATVSAADTWVEVSFDMSGWIGLPDGNPDQIIMFPDRSDRTADHIIYIDDVIFGAVPTPTCSDGIQNGDETGVDCGGSNCDACPALSMTVSVPFETTECKITGPWWGWDPNAGPIGVDNGDDTFTFTFDPAPSANMEYLYVADGVQEILYDNAANGDCTNRIDNGNLITDYANWGNRIWKVSDNYTWNEVYDSCVEATMSISDFEIVDLKVFPNPTKNIWNIKFNNQKISSIQVFDLLGKQVMVLSPDANEALINGSILPNGLYFAQIKTTNGMSSVKLVKK